MLAAVNRHLRTEISTQPADWLRAIDRAGREAPVLPAPGERVAVVGCGTSLYMAQSIAALRERAGHGLTDAWAPTDHQLAREYDRVLVISRSGTTTEVLEFLDAQQRRAGAPPSTVIVADPTTPAVRLADHAIVLDDVDEQAVVQTRFATSTLALARAHLGQGAQVAIAATQAQEIIEADPEPLLGPALTAEQITFVGTGWTVGIANEAALKLRESAQAWTESYPALEYRHGPISITAPGRVTWAFGDAPVGLGDDVRATGGSFVHAAVDPLADLVRVHRLCLLRAEAQGIDADVPRNLTRSVILT